MAQVGARPEAQIFQAANIPLEKVGKDRIIAGLRSQLQTAIETQGRIRDVTLRNRALEIEIEEMRAMIARMRPAPKEGAAFDERADTVLGESVFDVESDDDFAELLMAVSKYLGKDVDLKTAIQEVKRLPTHAEAAQHALRMEEVMTIRGQVQRLRAAEAAQAAQVCAEAGEDGPRIAATRRQIGEIGQRVVELHEAVNARLFGADLCTTVFAPTLNAEIERVVNDSRCLDKVQRIYHLVRGAYERELETLRNRISKKDDRHARFVEDAAGAAGLIGGAFPHTQRSVLDGISLLAKSLTRSRDALNGLCEQLGVSEPDPDTRAAALICRIQDLHKVHDRVTRTRTAGIRNGW